MKKSYVKPSYSVIILLCAAVLSLPADDGDLRPANSDLMIPALNFKETDIRDIFRAIAYEYEVNIVIDNTINERVSVALFNISVFDAVNVIAKDNGFVPGWDRVRFYVKRPEPEEEPPPVENKPAVLYEDGRLWIIAHSVDIGRFVDEVAEASGRNILVTTGTTGRVSGQLRDVDFDTGLQSYLRNNGFYLRTADDIYYVSRSRYFSSLEEAGATSLHPYWVSVVDERITIDVRDAELTTVLDDLSNQTGFPLIKLARPDVKVTVKGTDLSLSRALDNLFKGTDYSYSVEDGTFIIGKKDSEVLQGVKLVKLKHLRASNIREIIPRNMLEGVDVNVVIEHNGLVINGSNDRVSSLVRYLDEIDKPVPQVFIEALVVDYNADKTFEFGITAGRGDIGLTTERQRYLPAVDVTADGNMINEFFQNLGKRTLSGTGIGLDFGKLGTLPSDFYINLRAMEERGLANIRSRPVLSALNGHTASLEIGTIQNYVFTEIMPITNVTGTTFIEKEVIESIEATISFEITPWVGPSGDLTLEIKPEFQTPVGQFTPDKRFIPAINIRTFYSTVTLRDGETIILGGLIQESEIDVQTRVPILGSIPILGRLFRSERKETRKSELVVYITPTIHYGDGYMGPY